jgi:hypothetical protein
MSWRGWLALALLWPWLALAAPRVQVDSRLSPPGPYRVGSTLRLEVDLLSNTWFTQAPQPADLQLAGALVSPPNGQADKLSLQRDGESWFGLRLSYLISPTTVGEFNIPALTFKLQVGQAQAPITVQSAAQHFSASAATSDGAQALLLSAQQLRFSQVVTPSATPLRVGDSLTRLLRVEADGAQAMLIPPAEFSRPSGLKAYPQMPVVSTLDDGRGAIRGGHREDSISYIIEQPGHYQLPAMHLQWWDSHTASLRSADVAAVSFEALAGTPTPPAFDLQADLQRLGHGLRIQLSAARLGLGAALCLLLCLLYLGRAWLSQQRLHLYAWLRRRWHAWRTSEGCAWRQLRKALRQQSLPLPALYRWLAHTHLGPHLGALQVQLPASAAQALEHALQQHYGHVASGIPSTALLAGLRSLRRRLRAQARRRKHQQGLRPLNPEPPKAQ